MIKFIYIGQIRREKGVGDLVQACQMLIDLGYQFELNVFGPYAGWQHDQFSSKISSRIKNDVILSRFIYFHGEVEDVDAAFLKNDVHVAPTITEEPYGLVVVEAKKNYRPSIIYPSGGMQELVSNGVSGVVCDDKSPTSLFLAMKFLLDNPHVIPILGQAAHLSLQELKITSNDFNRSWREVLSIFSIERQL